MTMVNAYRRRAALKAACNTVLDRTREGVPAKEILEELERDHAARRSVAYGAYTLSVAGVRATCTWSADTGLLANWRKTATLHLAAEPMS
jgi:hypothetical protein